MPHDSKEPKKKLNYSKPLVTELELTVEEAVLQNCKMTGGDNGQYGKFGCGGGTNICSTTSVT
jgi:hypothetical protein